MQGEPDIKRPYRGTPVDSSRRLVGDVQQALNEWGNILSHASYFSSFMVACYLNGSEEDGRVLEFLNQVCSLMNHWHVDFSFVVFGTSEDEGHVS